MKRSDEKFHSAEVIQWVNGNRKEPDQALMWSKAFDLKQSDHLPKTFGLEKLGDC